VATVGLSRIHRLAVAWGLVLGSSAWAAALVLAPFLLTHRYRSGPSVTVSVLAYVLGGAVCHQRSARTFVLWGAPMPVCARCAGLYGGAALGAAAAVLVAYRRRWRRLGRGGWESLGAWRVGLVLAAAPTVATLVLETMLGVPMTNSVRSAAGAVLGAAVGWVAAASLRGREASMDEVPEVN
jgi:hypothetical protein